MENRSTLFKMAYEGPALISHEMNVKDFAPALLSIGELLEDSNRILNGEQIKIVVNIKATDPGSIQISLSVVQTLIDQARSLFNDPSVTAIINAKELLEIILGGGSCFGVLHFIKWIKKRKIKNIIKLDTGDFNMEIEDGEAKIISNKEMKLFGLVKIRKNIEAIVRTPLNKEGIDKVVFKSGNFITEINRDEADYFTAPETDSETIGETETETNLQIINISFLEGRKWRFNDGNSSFFADILDNEFLDNVEKNREVFAKDDILRVRLRNRQYLMEGIIKAENTIIKVIKHTSAAVQIKLPFKN